MASQAVVMSGKSQILFAQFLATLAALGLEIKGMRRRGRSAYAICKERYGVRGNKYVVEAELQNWKKVLESGTHELQGDPTGAVKLVPVISSNLAKLQQVADLLTPEQRETFWHRFIGAACGALSEADNNMAIQVALDGVHVTETAKRYIASLTEVL